MSGALRASCDGIAGNGSDGMVDGAVVAETSPVAGFAAASAGFSREAPGAMGADGACWVVDAGDGGAGSTSSAACGAVDGGGEGGAALSAVSTTGAAAAFFPLLSKGVDVCWVLACPSCPSGFVSLVGVSAAASFSRRACSSFSCCCFCCNSCCFCSRCCCCFCTNGRGITGTTAGRVFVGRPDGFGTGDLLAEGAIVGRKFGEVSSKGSRCSGH